MTNTKQTPGQWEALQKAGRCANGNETDHGVVIHAVPDGHEYCHMRALCKTSPGRRSVGWVKPYASQEITCEKCRDVIAEAENAASQQE